MVILHGIIMATINVCGGIMLFKHSMLSYLAKCHSNRQMKLKMGVTVQNLACAHP